MSKEQAKRTFSELRPGDVLIHCSNDDDVSLVLRVGETVDLLHLSDGRFLEAWVAATAGVPATYDVLRGTTLVMSSHLWMQAERDEVSVLTSMGFRL